MRFRSAAIALEAPVRAVAMWLPGVDWAVTFGVLALLSLVGLLAATVLIRVNHQTFLKLHRLLGLLLLPSSLHVFAADGHLAANPGLRYYLIALTAAGALAYLYHTALGGRLIKRYPYTVTAVYPLGADVTEVVLEPRWRPLVFMPGQFVYLGLADAAVDSEPHPFSISSGNRRREIVLSIKRLGDYTAEIGSVRPGAAAYLEGPFGNFSYLATANRQQIWCAGGIGITPFLAMVRSFPANLAYEIDLFYCGKSVDDLLFAGELQEAANLHPTFRLHHIREDADGFLSVASVQRLVDTAAAEVFVCGPPAMLASLHTQFLAAGVPEGRLHYERFGFR